MNLAEHHKKINFDIKTEVYFLFTLNPKHFYVFMQHKQIQTFLVKQFISNTAPNNLASQFFSKINN